MVRNFKESHSQPGSTSYSTFAKADFVDDKGLSKNSTRVASRHLKSITNDWQPGSCKSASSSHVIPAASTSAAVRNESPGYGIISNFAACAAATYLQWNRHAAAAFRSNG